MKMFSANPPVPSLGDADNLRVALDIERQIASAVSNIAERSVDRHLATEFKRRLKQSESHIARLENLFRSTTRAAA